LAKNWGFSEKHGFGGVGSKFQKKVKKVPERTKKSHFFDPVF
jgi:hypothetical protein